MSSLYPCKLARALLFSTRYLMILYSRPGLCAGDLIDADDKEELDITMNYVR